MTHPENSGLPTANCQLCGHVIVYGRDQTPPDTPICANCDATAQLPPGAK